VQVHTNKESREKQLGKKPGPNQAETGLGRPAWADRPSPSRARFGAPFDLAASRAIYSPLAESHAELHSSSAAEETTCCCNHPRVLRSNRDVMQLE
jgi:hypothetical protein